MFYVIISYSVVSFPRLVKRELIFLLSITCNVSVAVRMGVSLPLGAWDSQRYSIVALPVPSI